MSFSLFLFFFFYIVTKYYTLIYEEEISNSKRERKLLGSKFLWPEFHCVVDLGSSVSSTETDINTRVAKAWTGHMEVRPD